MKEYRRKPAAHCTLSTYTEEPTRFFFIDDTTTRKLVKLLLPSQRVPENCAIRILGSLGKHLSFSIQVHTTTIIDKREA